METSTPVWVAIVVAVIALLGVLIAQSIALYNERTRRRDEQTKLVREEVHAVMMTFFNFSAFAQTTWPGKRMDTVCEVYDEEWSKVAGPLAAGAANMAGRGRHRDAALTLMDGIGLQSTAYREGESIGQTPQIGYIQMSWAGFEIVAAWLRGEALPRHARRVTRSARRMRTRLDAEYASRRLTENEARPTGVVRFAFRKTRWWVKAQWKKWIARPALKVWNFLFAP
ncbi:hypothetical protein FVA74_05975 [Salinibacterium sp. dk2585]|uniref:hypothetical protein n=1 Tax=unclassified Salinibacterium TaxID=2632331 RepID=UPI0011C257F5|nr:MULTISPECIES: hypothetical protein [unclassified Salinibacterium]QEE61173.1 hypothetical protein FVA74_05975 [Salinibacterium sp. dk2585]TXK53848.1 hypothetical protein FVP63_07425 [Salinibacterium sp. dk5596]